MIKRCNFWQVIKYSYPKKLIFGHFQVIFLNLNFFQERNGFFPVDAFRDEFSNVNMSSSLSEQRVVQFFAEIPFFGILDYLGPASKLIISTYSQNISSLWSVSC